MENLGLINAIDVSLGTKKIYVIEEDYVDHTIDTEAKWSYPVAVAVRKTELTDKNTVIINAGMDSEVEIPVHHKLHTSEELCQQSCFEINSRIGKKYDEEVERVFELLERAQKIAKFYKELATNPKAFKTTKIS